ncbi:MAG: type I-U CRISPR-associated protein Cas5/Cas6 [Roseococcus sp.]|nr:type I-U CRISPR-associated protein Cas5/Cas6 [Roseococcus sp.]
MLAVEVEYLTGVARAANDRGDAPDWPPQPDRLFSALVATWAARGEKPKERAALEWLECADPPTIEASSAAWRGAAKVFVPPNDDGATAVEVLPERRRRQERRFPACIPIDPVVRWVWPVAPSNTVAEALDSLARDTSFLGHSASLVRCAVRRVSAPSKGVAARRTIYPGRLVELIRRFEAGQRPSPGASLAPSPIVPALPISSVFGTEWIIFAHGGGWQPDARAAALVGKTLIKAVQAGYAPDAAPAWVSGHQADGSPLLGPHLATVPLLDAGWEWSQGRLMGIALVLPRILDQAAGPEEAGLFQALSRINTEGPDDLQINLRLPGGRVWRLRREALPDAKSLRPDRYVGEARIWASATPIALDRHPKAEGEIEAIIEKACERIGLPQPIRVVAGKHTAIRGAPSAQPRFAAPDWTGWRLPEQLRGRRLTHAVIEFAEPVAGPVLLGAGRFVGLGLCLPLREAATE